MNELPPLLTVEEVRRLIGRHRVGRDQLYKLARQYGMALGKRYLMPRRVVLALLEGRLDELEEKSPAGQSGAA